MDTLLLPLFLSCLCAHFCVRTFCLDCASVFWLHHSFLSFSHVGASHLRKPIVFRSMAPCLFLIVMCSSVNNNDNNNNPGAPAVFHGVSCHRLPLGGSATFLAPVACPAPPVEPCCWVSGVFGAPLGVLPCAVLLLRGLRFTLLTLPQVALGGFLTFLSPGA